MRRRWLPWRTLIQLGFTTWLLVVVLSIWWQSLRRPGWTFTWQTWTPWEPWADAVVLHAGAVFLGWRWWGLVKSLWRRFGPF